MNLAIKEAENAFLKDEIPVGVIIVNQGEIIAKAHNQVEQYSDVTAHAEIIAMTAASNYYDSKYLNECTMYVTLEPCLMCAGALRWARIGTLVYGAYEEKNGFSSKHNILLHPSTVVIGGLEESKSKALLYEFFARKRN